MNLNFSYKPGMRLVKTALAVALCLIIELAIGRQNPFYACIAAVVCMLPSYRETFYTGLNRIIGTVIGGLFGYALIELGQYVPFYTEWARLLLIPAIMMAVIYILNVFGKPAAVSIGCIVFLSITANPARTYENALIFVIDRILDTCIGIVVAMLVNRFIVPHKKGEEPQNLPTAKGLQPSPETEVENGQSN